MSKDRPKCFAALKKLEEAKTAILEAKIAYNDLSDLKDEGFDIEREYSAEWDGSTVVTPQALEWAWRLLSWAHYALEDHTVFPGDEK